MDGGVKIKAPVAGIAMGLMKEGGDWVVLTDIQGPEDHHGDMDLKVAGTENGITAIQMDIKLDGIPFEVLEEALPRAESARLKILDVIKKEIAGPNENISASAPAIEKIQINKDMIGAVIGGGGATIKALRTETGVKDISIEDDGSVTISGDAQSIADAKERILAIAKTFEVGEEMEVEVVRITDFGAFAKLNNSTDGLIHISEFAPQRINRVEDIVKIGDFLPVVIKTVERDKIGLSVKDRDPKYFDNFLKNIPKPKTDSKMKLRRRK